MCFAAWSSPTTALLTTYYLRPPSDLPAAPPLPWTYICVVVSGDGRGVLSLVRWSLVSLTLVTLLLVCVNVSEVGHTPVDLRRL